VKEEGTLESSYFHLRVFLSWRSTLRALQQRRTQMSLDCNLNRFGGCVAFPTRRAWLHQAVCASRHKSVPLVLPG